jgi:hypothetical protein
MVKLEQPDGESQRLPKPDVRMPSLLDQEGQGGEQRRRGYDDGVCGRCVVCVVCGGWWNEIVVRGQLVKSLEVRTALTAYHAIWRNGE